MVTGLVSVVEIVGIGVIIEIGFGSLSGLKEKVIEGTKSLAPKFSAGIAGFLRFLRAFDFFFTSLASSDSGLTDCVSLTSDGLTSGFDKFGCSGWAVASVAAAGVLEEGKASVLGYVDITI